VLVKKSEKVASYCIQMNHLCQLQKLTSLYVSNKPLLILEL
jgi:hypothetical protein